MYVSICIYVRVYVCNMYACTTYYHGNKDFLLCFPFFLMCAMMTMTVVQRTLTPLDFLWNPSRACAKTSKKHALTGCPAFDKFDVTYVFTNY